MQPYLLKETRAYQDWRARKLYKYPKQEKQLLIELNNPIKLTDNEKFQLRASCAKTNIAIYRCLNAQQYERQNDKHLVAGIAQQLGLQQLDANLCADEDCISVIQDTGEQGSHYIPYTNKALNWHTDGYYNANDQRIHAFLMHCVRPAKNGGENSYLDPEIAYILLRDENPDYIEALMQNDVMTIPANEIDGKQVRSAQTGPVFFIDKKTQAVCMRYTARKRNIVWKQNKIVQQAIDFLHEILQNSPYIFRYTLSVDEGVVCNNVLHNRTAYEDYQDENKKRLLYRGRFYNRVATNQKNLNQAVNH